jgi:hypothetical protein
MIKRVISISTGKFFSDLLPIDLLVVIYKFFKKVSIITLKISLIKDKMPGKSSIIDLFLNQAGQERRKEALSPL